VFRENSVRPFVTQTYVDDPAIISMVEHRHGISMLSHLILTDMQNSTAKFVPVVPEISRTLAVAFRSDHIPQATAKRLIALTKEYIKD
jgi:DNA-binding transcriptional LysR family regulator